MVTDVAEAQSSSGSNRVSIFPPCRVCGGTASGFHYGANTCEACKIFFMRSLKYKPRCEYRCSSKTKTCLIKANKRNCHGCRFQRCLSIGMSRNASKIGRYTIHQRHLIHEEVVNHVDSLESTVVSNHEDIFQEIAERLSESSKVHDIYGLVPRDAGELLQRQKDFIEWYLACCTSIGELHHLSDPEYNEFFTITGLDIDNRNSILQSTVLMLQRGIEKQVKFSKTIPGFKKLTLSDQTNIIKASVFDYLWLCASRCVNVELGIRAIHTGRMYTLSHIRYVLDGEILQESFTFSGKLNQLGLFDEEIALLKAVCIMFTDRVVLEDKDTVDKIQWKLMGCLRWLLRRNHSKHKNTFFKLWNCVLMMRGISERFRQFVDNISTRCPENVDCALLMEIQ